MKFESYLSTTVLSIGVAVAVSNGTAFAEEKANATSVAHYKKMSQDERFQTLTSALAIAYNHYSQVQPNADIASCILDLFNNPDHPRPNGYDRFEIGVSAVNAGENANEISIQQVLLGIINRQCTE